ncbi:MAG TPA: hypothetical protein VFU31_11495, partial [Candidatus Binatia bacterium]|nr:hypothetical protein [Candidatus Binatia bacterium]
MKLNINLPKTPLNQLIAVFAVLTFVGGGWYWYASAARAPQRDALRPIAVTRGTIEEVVTSQG